MVSLTSVDEGWVVSPVLPKMRSPSGPLTSSDESVPIIGPGELGNPPISSGGATDREPRVHGETSNAALPPPHGGGRLRAVEVLLPALNEARAVGHVIDSIPTDYLRKRGYRVRVWVVDGRSTDGTLEIASARGASIFRQEGEGKGSGVRQAIDFLLRGEPERATTEPRGFVMLDADGSYPADRIPEFIRALESGMDVVTGSRFRGKREQGAITPLNHFGNRCLSRLASVLFGVRVTDVCTGMWAFREEAVQNFALAANGFDLEADLFASSCELGARFGEFPIEYKCRVGAPKLIPLRTGLLIAWRLLMKRLNRGAAPPSRSGSSSSAPRLGNARPVPLDEVQSLYTNDATRRATEGRCSRG